MSGDGIDAKLVVADCDTLYKLATRYSPFLRYHEKERFFPILAESWLRMTTAAPWAADPHVADKDLGDHPLDPHSRGTALFVPGLRPFGPAQVVAGPPVAGDRALQFSFATDDPYAIGRTALATATARTFLDVGGWLDPGTRKSGDVEYLAALYSELGSAINENVPWTPMDRFDNVPHSWCPQSPNPTTYCEVTWAGSQQRLAEQRSLSDLAPGDRILDSWVAFTYHYLYAAREPSGPDDTTRHLEGQWESVTLFFTGGPMTGRDKTVRNMVATEPTWIVLSEGYDRSLDRHLTDLRAWNHPDVEHNGDHPVVYVGLGTHRQFWKPQSGTVWDPTANPPQGSDPGVHDDEDETLPGFEPFLEAAYILLWLAALALAIPPPWGEIIALVLFVARAVPAAVLAGVAHRRGAEPGFGRPARAVRRQRRLQRRRPPGRQRRGPGPAGHTAGRSRDDRRPVRAPQHRLAHRGVGGELRRAPRRQPAAPAAQPRAHPQAPVHRVPERPSLRAPLLVGLLGVVGRRGERGPVGRLGERRASRRRGRSRLGLLGLGRAGPRAAQLLNDGLRGLGPTEQVALRELAAHRAERLALHARLDSLGDDVEVEGVAE